MVCWCAVFCNKMLISLPLARFSSCRHALCFRAIFRLTMWDMCHANFSLAHAGSTVSLARTLMCGNISIKSITVSCWQATLSHWHAPSCTEMSPFVKSITEWLLPAGLAHMRLPSSDMRTHMHRCPYATQNLQSFPKPPSLSWGQLFGSPLPTSGWQTVIVASHRGVSFAGQSSADFSA